MIDGPALPIQIRIDKLKEAVILYKVIEQPEYLGLDCGGTIVGIVNGS